MKNLYSKQTDMMHQHKLHVRKNMHVTSPNILNIEMYY